MMREIGGILIGFYGLLYLWQLSQLPAGANAYDAFVETLYSPLFVAFGAVVFVFSLVHTLSWFSLVPKALPPKVERMGVPAVAIVGGFVVLWLIVSWLVAVIVFGL
jgi:fumarate reductase subunit C